MEENEEKIRIDRILGLSVTSNAHFDCDSGLVAYPAGNTVVLLDAGSGTVLTHVVLETRKSISALQLKSNSLLFVASEDSNFLRICNWQTGVVKDISPCQNVVCLAVSSVLGLLVTVGSDRVVSVWDFKGLTGNQSRNGNTPGVTTPTGQPSLSRGRKLASSSVACKVSCVTFSPDGKFFVTGGTRHLKFWYLQLGKNECVLTGRPAILGSEHSNADFRDVLTDGTATYATANFDGTISATLCQFDERRFLDKWVQLKTKQAFCMAMEDDLIFIGCAEGLIRCFRSGRLDFVATLPLPHHLGVDIEKATDVTALSSHPPVSKFPNVVGISAPGGKKIVAVYADHSLYAWDVQDVKRVGLSHSWLWHSGCIWDVALGPPSQAGGPSSFLHWPSFVTCSNDDTIRRWDIISQLKNNLYSNECQDIKYISTRYLDISPLFSISHGNGVRCVGIGSTFVCCGDRQGNLRLWRSKTKNEVIKIKAHKEEVLAMDVKGSLVATASRDGSVNLYNIGKEIERIASLQDHKGTVTSVKFFNNDRSNPPAFLVISCGADKNLIFRQMITKSADGQIFSDVMAFLEGDVQGDIEIHVTSVVASKTPLFDLEIDTNGKHALVACQDSCVRVYNLSTSKHSKTLRNPNATNMGTIIKVTLDPSGYYVAVASTDKSITVFDYYKGDVVATLVGHSELATALRFTPDFQNLLSVGGDSCIFVWTLPREIVVTMEARMNEKRSRQSTKKSITPTTASSTSPANPPSPVRTSDYRFSFGQLPDWAKKHVKGPDKSSEKPILPKKPSLPTLPQGKWSERVEQASGALTIKSFYDSDTIVPVPFSKSQNNLDTVGRESVEPVNRPHPQPFKMPPPPPPPKPTLPEAPKDSGVRSLEYDESLKDLDKDLEGDDEESTDFYSDVNKSTDGEASEPPQVPPRTHVPKVRSDTDTDDSSSTRASSKRVASYMDKSNGNNSYEINRSRNMELIMSVKAKNREISKSRLELEKRLDETRKKLQSIGYKSMSQSTHDLSRSYAKEYLDDTDEDNEAGESGGIRRACSLSDLNVIPVANNSSSSSSSRRKRSFHRHRNDKPRSGPSGFDPQNLLTRSTSVSALMNQAAQSDSEPESLPANPSYMSKTISSQGKLKRKTPSSLSAYSQENLRDSDDGRMRVSASEQNLTKIGKSLSPRSKMNTPMMKKPQQVHGITRGNNMAVVTGVRQGEGDDAPLTLALANNSIDVLRKSFDHVMHLRTRAACENIPDDSHIIRILEDGLRSMHKSLLDSMEDPSLKIITDHGPTMV